MVSDRDRARMQRLGRDLADTESIDRGTDAERSAIFEAVNTGRADAGRPPLVDRAPEEGIYDRARALGMARIDR